VNQADYVLVLTTLPAGQDAAALARTLVSERLAACVSVLGDMQSTYWWEGRIEQSTERQLVIKTTAARWPLLAERIRDLHPYEIPEILAVPIQAALPAYLRWVSEVTI